jgi:putative aldouronate transport system substrate-binding protein
MRKKMKVFNLLLAAVMLVGLLAACSSNNNNNESANATNSTPSSSTENTGQASASVDEAIKEPYEITLAMPVFGAIPKDMEAVQAEINKISQAKINATVKILPISIGAWQQQMNLMMSGGEKLDLAFTFGQSYSNQAATGQLLPIDELLTKYGQGIEQAVGTEYLKSANVGGKIYGVPTIHDFAGKSGIMMRKDLVEKYKIDVASIKSWDDLDSVFKTIKDNEPGIAPLASSVSGPVEAYLTYDMLGDRYGVLPGFDNGLKVENYYESADYADLLNRMHNWFKAGYINKDAATSQLIEPNIVKADKAFSYFLNFHPAIMGQEERKIGKEMVFAELQPEHYATTSKVLVGLWGISQNSENPERAMMFLNLMYTDKDIVNLMLWGIEDKHYVKVSDTSIDYPAGLDSKTVGYFNEFWLMGNPFLSYTMKAEDPEIWNKTKAYNESAVKSKALGFAFNTEPVKNEITALSNVTQQYRKILETGTIDPAKKLPEFISKLKAAGIDKVIAEKQKQLDAWAAANK